MTMGNAEIHSLFPTPIYVIDGFMLSEEKQNRLIQESLSDGQQNLCGNLVSSNRYVLDLDYLSDLKDYLQLHLNKYAYEVYNITPTVQFYITQSWLNINDTNTSHHVHGHANSFFSGTYYIKGETPISFHKDVTAFQNFEFDMSTPNQFNAQECTLPIQQGRCILFPSVLKHFVSVNNTNTQRVSLSFNCFFKGELKVKKDNATYLKMQ